MKISGCNPADEGEEKMKIRGKDIPLHKLPDKVISFIKDKRIQKRNDRKAMCCLRNHLNLQHDKNEKIKVGFIVQMPEIWDKQFSVYHLMSENSKFETWLLIVPAYDFTNDTIGEYGEEKNFFISQCINGNFLLAKENGKWINIETLGFDYLFYQRPYDHYLPCELKSDQTVKYTKICYIPYATPEIKKTVIYPRSFFRNIYFGFMEDEGAAERNTKRFHKTCAKKLQHFCNIGYPSFEKCLRSDKNCRYDRILWTPRWSYDPVIGGSHFMEYNQQLTEFDWGKHSFCIRPHPMMWQNLIKIGKLTDQEVGDIQNQWAIHNITVDKNKSIEETFSQTDILLSDTSSVIPMFFLTEKPIIYCAFNIDFSSLLSKVLPGLYIVNTWNELESCLKMLFDHKDPLKPVRKKIIDQYFSQHRNATENIVQSIIDDYDNI